MIASKRTAEILRVNHAGEIGAVYIYKGQLAVLKNKSSLVSEIEHMADQEEEHCRQFNQVIINTDVRPTVLLPVWQAVGYVAGMGSALLGEKAAMALTVAVENVIDEHYEKQLKEIPDLPVYQSIRSLIQKCHQEELQHRDTGLHHHAEEMPGYKIFNRIVKKATKAAIWLSEKI